MVSVAYLLKAKKRLKKVLKFLVGEISERERMKVIKLRESCCQLNELILLSQLINQWTKEGTRRPEVRIVLYLTRQAGITQWAVTFLNQVSLRSHPRYSTSFSDFHRDLRNPGEKKKEQATQMRLIKHQLSPSQFTVSWHRNKQSYLAVCWLVDQQQTNSTIFSSRKEQESYHYLQSHLLYLGNSITNFSLQFDSIFFFFNFFSAKLLTKAHI